MSALILPAPEEIGDDLPAIVKVRGAEICLKCRFSRLLCGRPACPILMKLSSYSRLNSGLGKEVAGGSPPSVFVGRYGYPKVSLGPLLPPIKGETKHYDEPEEWHGLGFSEIVEFRMAMVRAKTRVAVEDAKNPSGMLYDLQCSLLSSSSVDTELKFTKPPMTGSYLDDTSAPFGPSAPVERYRFSPGRTDRRLEKVYYDRDLKAADALVSLYESGVTVNSIQKLLSTGMLGVRRRLVPTRWSITAVDDTLSKAQLESVKSFDSIDLFRVFIYDMLGSRYLLLFAPGSFAYEWVEAWFPRTVWNPAGATPQSIGDHEGFRGRNTYATPGGCYYSVRLAVSEYLSRLRRQAVVVALREIYPGQLLPLGVWNVREAIRLALSTQPEVFDNIDDALRYSLSRLTLGKGFWLANSHLLRELLTQRKLENFV